MSRLAGKVAIVTGGNPGSGRAVALAYADRTLAELREQIRAIVAEDRRRW
jgi:NAD(P)-dependent dehydrogenase (short-subunit alcohol dehydrogenase family)